MKVIAVFCSPDQLPEGAEAVCVVERRRDRLADWPDARIVSHPAQIYRFAADCLACPDCGEPWCEICKAHLHECSCIGCSEWDDEIGVIDGVIAEQGCHPEVMDVCVQAMRYLINAGVMRVQAAEGANEPEPAAIH